MQSAIADVPAHTGANKAAIDPYLLDLRGASEARLSEEDCSEQCARRNSTNAAVALTDIGHTSHLQHQAVSRIAQEYALNRKQRLAFYIFANGLLA